jgi:ribosomal protein S13
VRFFLILLFSLLSYGSEFPAVFSSVGDDIYANMQRYNKIKDLDIYKDRPELLEAYCIDANISLQEGLELDKMKDDPEVIMPKERIKAYAKNLRILSKKNEAIMQQLDRDVTVLREAKDYTSLASIHQAGFILSAEILREIEVSEAMKTLQAQAKEIKPVDQKTKKTSILEKKLEEPKQKSPQAVVKKPEVKPVVLPPVQKPEKKKVLTELEKYEESLKTLKEELYALRESSDTQKMTCLNDITAINYWMIRVLENENDSCAFADAIKQMKAYSKASAKSCGRDSMRYIEWHGRIKPYVGKKLFEAEANCHR